MILISVLNCGENTAGVVLDGDENTGGVVLDCGENTGGVILDCVGNTSGVVLDCVGNTNTSGVVVHADCDIDPDEPLNIELLVAFDWIQVVP